MFTLKTGNIQLALVAGMIVTVIVIKIVKHNAEQTLMNERTFEPRDLPVPLARRRQHFEIHGKCDLPRPCPDDHFTFQMSSGAGDIISAKICLEGKMIVNDSKKAKENGIIIAVINAQTGELIQKNSFNMKKDANERLIKFLQSAGNDTFLMMTTFDDAASKLNNDARGFIRDLGSAQIAKLKPRDNWVFVGRKGMRNESPFEERVPNNKQNKYGKWPEIADVGGCIPHDWHD